MPEEKQFIGSCLCGALCFQVTDPKWCANCHCSMCRKIHGAPYVTWVGFTPETFRVIKGKEYLKQYVSSSGVQRGSCNVCGSQMFFQSERWPDEIHVTHASLPDELDLRAEAHYFFDDRAPWVQIKDDLPRYGGKTGTESIE